MTTRIIDHDPITNITHLWHDHGDGRFSTWSEQEVTPLLEQNLAMRNMTKRRDRWGPGKQVAELPMVVLMDLKKQGILDDQEAFHKWLDSAAALPFRTAVGSLSR
jgi:hypothetical protein